MNSNATELNEDYWKRTVGFDDVQFNVKAVDRRLALRALPPKGLVLDAGGSAAVDAGFFVLAKRSKVVVLDIVGGQLVRGLRFVRKAGLERNVDFVCASVVNLPFRGASFQAVTCFSVLDHLPRMIDVVESLREFVRILASQGKLVVTFPNLLCFSVTLSSMVKQHLDSSQFWERRFSPKFFQSMLRQVGFRPVVYDYGSASRLGKGMLRDNMPGMFAKLPTSVSEASVIVIAKVTNRIAAVSKLFGPRFGILAVKNTR